MNSIAPEKISAPGNNSTSITPTRVLVLGALGVVFGDIGTSPLYALQAVFAVDNGVVTPNTEDVMGVISLMFWSLLLVVSVKYVTFVMRADNEGEGGVLALAHLTRHFMRRGGRRYAAVMLLGVLGASLFYGDSVITPAISVLSAVEGLQVAAPSLAHIVLPLGVLVIIGLFVVQRLGTAIVGRAFGPVMIAWFSVLAIMGMSQILKDPSIVWALSPHHGLYFVVKHPAIAFFAMGAVVLVVTGAEALYADMGHFGRRPIAIAWFFLVFPALTLNYLGQGSLVLSDPSAAKAPFFLLAPEWARIPLVALATMATLIASQAVISGAFSVSREAERLGYLPRLTVKQTSEERKGQIYIPSINWILCAGVLVLIAVFQSSEKLATAYGLAVTSTFLITTALFLTYAHQAWKWPLRRVLIMGAIMYLLEGSFFIANVAKVLHGGWLPLLIAVVLCTIMLTWYRGRELVTVRRRKLEGPLRDLVTWLRTSDVTQVPGTAIFLHPDKETAPLALAETVRFNHVVHENVWIVTTTIEHVPHVDPEDRVEIDDLGDPDDGIAHITLRYGFQDDPDVPAGLRQAQSQGIHVDVDDAVYFVSRITVHISDRPGLARWRKRLFSVMARNAATPVEYFRLPVGQVVIMGAQVLF